MVTDKFQNDIENIVQEFNFKGNGKFKLIERAPNVSISEIVKFTEGELIIDNNITSYQPGILLKTLYKYG